MDDVTPWLVPVVLVAALAVGVVVAARALGRRSDGGAAGAGGIDDVARMCAQAERSIDIVSRSLGAAIARGCAVGGLPSVAARLLRRGIDLDQELRLVAREEDVELQQIWLGLLTEQVREHRAECLALRRSVHRLELASGPGPMARAADPFAGEAEHRRPGSPGPF
jgi:hypothetical protein